MRGTVGAEDDLGPDQEGTETEGIMEGGEETQEEEDLQEGQEAGPLQGEGEEDLIAGAGGATGGPDQSLMSLMEEADTEVTDQGRRGKNRAAQREEGEAMDILAAEEGKIDLPEQELLMRSE